MSFQNVLDAMSIGTVFVVYAIIAAAVSEGGYRFGCWWQDRSPEESQGPTGMMVGSLLGLMGFLLAITMGMAADRFDTRRGVVLSEANSLGTTYLRAGYLPEPASTEIRNLLREYVPLRITTADLAETKQKIARSVEIHAQLWTIAEKLASEAPDSDLLALFVVSLNESIDLHQTRVVAGIYARVPATILLILLVCSLLTLAMVGYNAGLTRRRSPVAATVMITILCGVITLVIDLDRSRSGFLTVDQQSLLDLQQQIGAAPPARPIR
jgi:hypothetical protein